MGSDAVLQSWAGAAEGATKQRNKVVTVRAESAPGVECECDSTNTGSIPTDLVGKASRSGTRCLNPETGRNSGVEEWYGRPGDHAILDQVRWILRVFLSQQSAEMAAMDKPEEKVYVCRHASRHFLDSDCFPTL
jgi:hypothetical protein